MIVTRPEGATWHPINIGRPDILPEYPDSVKWHRQIHDWLEETPHKLSVNGMHSYILEVLNEVETTGKGGYLGGGFKYVFWFETHEGREEFIQFLEDNSDFNVRGSLGYINRDVPELYRETFVTINGKNHSHPRDMGVTYGNICHLGEIDPTTDPVFDCKFEDGTEFVLDEKGQGFIISQNCEVTQRKV